VALQRYSPTVAAVPKLGGDYSRQIASRQATEYLYSGGILGEDEHPSRILREKSEPGDRVGELYDRMIETDATLGGLDEKRVKAVMGLPYSVIPGDESDEAQEIADTCAEMLDKIKGLGTNLQHQLGAVPRGCAIDELGWVVQRERLGRLTGLWRVAEAWDRPLCRFGFKEGVLHVRRRNGQLEPALPAKFIHGYYGTKDSAWGRPLLDRLYWFHWLTLHAWKYYGVALEKWAQPTVEVEYERSQDTTVNAERVAQALDIAASIQTEFAIARPKDIAVNLLEALRGAGVSYESFIQLLDRAKALVWLGEIDTSGLSQGPGSFAKSVVSNEVRFETIKSDATWLAEVLTDQLIRPFVLVNFGLDAPMPYWEFDVEEASDRELRQAGAAAVLEAGEDVPLAYFKRLHQVPPTKKGEPTVRKRALAPVPAALVSVTRKTRIVPNPDRYPLPPPIWLAWDDQELVA